MPAIDVRKTRALASKLDTESLIALRLQAEKATDLTKLRAALVALIRHLEGTT